MEFGLGVLGLAPQVLWAMTPKELDAALRGRFGRERASTPPSLGDLTALMSLFPDSME